MPAFLQKTVNKHLKKTGLAGKQYFYTMNILRLAGEIFLIYILYKLVFEFIIPIYQTTKKVRKQFGDMHSKMQEQMNSDMYKNNRQQASTPGKPPATPQQNEEYIDYEEIK